MQDNYKEILQAVLEGKQLQFMNKNNMVPIWRDDHENDGSNERVWRILQDIHLYDYVVYRVKPEKKVFKYQTRAFINNNSKVTVWTSTDYIKQQGVERFTTFSHWVEPTQNHEVVYE